MNLREYIKEVGVETFAKRVKEKPRTVLSWLHGVRRPRSKVALKIIAKTPVTLDGIYKR